MSEQPSKDDLHHVIAVDELAEGDRVITEIRGTEIAVFNVDGTFHAIANHCTHQNGPVCEGNRKGILTADDDGELIYDRKGRILSCPWHGWEFDIETGEHVAQPRYQLITYSVLVRDGGLYVTR